MRGIAGESRSARAPAARLRRLGWVGLPLLLWATACAPALVSLPSGPGVPAPEYAAPLREATRACGGVRTLTAVMAVAGRAGGRRVRGRLLAGLERPGGLRLEGVAPFGESAFILAARDGRATLLLPHTRRVLRDADPEAVLDALTGLKLAPDDLLAIVSGCGLNRPSPTGARTYSRSWLRVDVAGGARLYLRRNHGTWRLVAVVEPALRVEYGTFMAGGVPRTLHLAGRRGDLDLQLTLSQVDLNVPIHAGAFRVAVPADATPITLGELRGLGLLGIRSGKDTHASSR